MLSTAKRGNTLRLKYSYKFPPCTSGYYVDRTGNLNIKNKHFYKETKKDALNQWKHLLNENVKAVVSMNQPYELMVCMNRRKDWERNNIEFLQLSTVDMFAAPTQENLLKGVAFINTFKGSGGSVYVHCKAGRSRSAVLVGCYLMQKHGWNPEEAASFMKAKRHQVSLRAFHWKALYLYYYNNIKKRPDEQNVTTGENTGQ